MEKQSRTITIKTIKIDRRKITILAIILAVIPIGLFVKNLLIAATVDGKPISRLAVISEIEKRDGKMTVDSIITEKLIEKEAKKQNITVTDEEVSEDMQKIEIEVMAQGGTFEEALLARGLDRKSFEYQVRIQNLLEKLLGDKIIVTDEEVQSYITDNKVTLPKDSAEETRTLIMDQLKNEKIGQEANILITRLRSEAKIKYYVNF